MSITVVLLKDEGGNPKTNQLILANLAVIGLWFYG